MSDKTYRFNTFCQWLNIIHLSYLAAAIRWSCYQLTRRHAQTGSYDNAMPDYRGWVEAKPFGCLAFIRTDGSLQFRW